MLAQMATSQGAGHNNNLHRTALAAELENHQTRIDFRVLNPFCTTRISLRVLDSR